MPKANPPRPQGFATTVTVRRSWPAATADGATALILETQELGTIAFALSPQAIAGLRDALAKAETMMALAAQSKSQKPS